jgi:type II secretory pathway component GspD/PulD (secretin)
VGSPPNTIFSQTVGGAFFKSGLILTFPTVQATIRALTQRGTLKSNNSPVTYTRTGEPAQIRAVTYQTIFLQTAATANVQATTTPYTFTTGLTIDVVPRILRGGIIDLKINPALSTQTGTSPAQPGTNTTVPIISTRSATADVPRLPFLHQAEKQRSYEPGDHRLAQNRQRNIYASDLMKPVWCGT